MPRADVVSTCHEFCVCNQWLVTQALLPTVLNRCIFGNRKSLKQRPSHSSNPLVCMYVSCMSLSKILLMINVSWIFVMSWLLMSVTYHLSGILLLSSRQHQIYDDCLEVRRENNQNCSVLYCVWQLCTIRHTHTWIVLKFACWFWFRFVFLCACLCLPVDVAHIWISLLLIYRPRKDEKLSQPSWRTL